MTVSQRVCTSRKHGWGPALVLSLFTLLALVTLRPAAQGVTSLGAEGTGSSQGSELLSGGSQTFEQIEFLPVEVAYPLGVELENEKQLRLVWQMPAGYYLYKHAFRFALERDTGEDPQDTPGAPDAIDIDVVYPPAIERVDEFFGRVEVYYDNADVTLFADAPIAGTRLTVSSQGCADAGLCYPPRTQNFSIDASGIITDITPDPRSMSAATALSDGAASVVSASTIASAPMNLSGLLPMLLLAFVGGMILNLMPCVLPILSLKVLSFACATPQERHRHGIFYSIGAVSGFVAIAILLIVLRNAGQAVGWGFQLQSPGFVIALAYLFVVLGLALSGVVELGNRFMNLGSDLASSGGAKGSFFTGLLAVVVASPCTAPFMGSALGYAVVQPAAVGLLVFAALGAGMAAPMLLLSYSGLARRYVPKPGPWMERVKQALAFPLYATALWLFWVAGRQTNVDVMAATLLGALLLALALWLWRGAMLARGTALACVAAALMLSSWRPDNLGDNGVAGQNLPAGSIAYSAETLGSLRAAGQAVFVDVTADWCITCLANERAVLATDTIQQAFRDTGVSYMVADWTDYDPAIAEFVASHGRSGIPLYVFYDGTAQIRVLPQILRKQTLLDIFRESASNSLRTGENRLIATESD
ncbi:MAG: protein-disulfide reductase DsbD family protein [Congregibacter sp.]